MIPAEVITFLGSSVVSGVLKLIARRNETKRLEADLEFRRMEQEQSGLAAARSFLPAGGPFARRLIVVAVMFTVFIAPVLTAWFAPGVPVYYAYSEMSRGFWIFWESLERLNFYRMDGLVLLPVHTHMASSIGGFYFGAGICNRGR